MQYAAVVAALVAAVAADGWENIETTTVPAPVYTTTVAPAPVYTTTVAPAPVASDSEWEAVSSIPYETTTVKPAGTTSYAVWSTTTGAPAYTTSAPPKYTGAASKANMVGAGAVGLAAVAFML